jgi:hypothetical protein
LVALVALAGCRFRVPAAASSDDIGAPSDDAAIGDAAALDLSGGSAADQSSMAADLSVTPTPELSGSKVAAPATVDLSLEGTSDWIHLGLNAANDVNRKATGGSQITESANATLVQYNAYSATFSWSEGSPTPSASNTPNGVYVLGKGKGFTITAPADTSTRTLRLYLNVGGTAALAAHLSDGSAPDYTDSQSNPNNGAIWLYTLRYAAASAGQTLSVSWQLSSGTGVSLIAATLQ